MTDRDMENHDMQNTEPFVTAEQTTIPGVDIPISQLNNAVKKPGGKFASIEATTTATRSEIKDIIGNVLYWYKRDQVKSDDECADRLNEFFQHIRETGEIPTVEKMCLALGIHRQTAWQWKTGQGCSAERTYMIKKAYDIMAALDAELVSKNKIPQVTYIFRSKNYYGMSDQTQLVITPNVPYQDGNVSDVNRLVEALPDPEKTEET